MTVGEIAGEFFGGGGKRLRPRLCRAVYAACGGTGDLSAVEDALECFHKASLAHDDAQDGDELRYGRPAVWKARGVAMAIAVGDWLLARGYDLVAHSGFPDAPGMLAACARAHLLLAEGQGDELAARAEGRALTVDEYVSVCARKTGEGFALAAELGARAAGTDPAAYRDYGLAWGVLYQIRDDAADGSPAVPVSRLGELGEMYERKTAFHRDQCALGVW